MTTDDMELVREYAAHQSESAFATLVSPLCKSQHMTLTMGFSFWGT
jgi:hypothetical protein